MRHDNGRGKERQTERERRREMGKREKEIDGFRKCHHKEYIPSAIPL